jgi:hypothetical protein
MRFSINLLENDKLTSEPLFAIDFEAYANVPAGKDSDDYSALPCMFIYDMIYDINMM